MGVELMELEVKMALVPALPHSQLIQTAARKSETESALAT